MKTGRPRKPTALKVLEGESRPCKINRREPLPRPIRPDCPDFLNDSARIIWDSLVDDLDAMGVLTIVDASTLAGYCAAYEEAQRLSRFLDEHGLTFETPQKYIAQRPEVGIRNKAWDRVAKFGSELGIGAASRSRIEVRKADDADEDPTAKAIAAAALRT